MRLHVLRHKLASSLSVHLHVEHVLLLLHVIGWERAGGKRHLVGMRRVHGVGQGREDIGCRRLHDIVSAGEHVDVYERLLAWMLVGVRCVCCCWC